MAIPNKNSRILILCEMARKQSQKQLRDILDLFGTNCTVSQEIDDRRDHLRVEEGVCHPGSKAPLSRVKITKARSFPVNFSSPQESRYAFAFLTLQIDRQGAAC